MQCVNPFVFVHEVATSEGIIERIKVACITHIHSSGRQSTMSWWDYTFQMRGGGPEARRGCQVQSYNNGHVLSDRRIHKEVSYTLGRVPMKLNLTYCFQLLKLTQNFSHRRKCHHHHHYYYCQSRTRFFSSLLIPKRITRSSCSNLSW